MDAVQISPAYVSEMEIRVLGPIEVIASGERLDLGGPKQRTVLAVLVANAGRRVSTDHLINAAYGDDAPDNVRRSIQTYVSNLRSLLGDMITSVKSGYEFTPVDSWVDAQQFVTQLDAARALTTEDPTSASAELNEALALWRGHPFHDIEAHGELDAETTRLSELRLVALESRIEADLAAGLDRELVGELEALTVEHPYREAFHSQQMIALYRAGRQADALRSYTRMRKHLAEDLGIDPSPTLRQLEQQILEQDPALQLTPQSAVQRRAVLVVDLAAGLGDVLGSPDDRRSTLIKLDRVVEESIADTGGSVASQRGTATYGTFEDFRSAIEAARRINLEAPRVAGSAVVRTGLDVGDVEEDPSGLVSGPAVIRAAGLASAAHPGQVLLSSDAHAAAAADPSGGWDLRALGRHPIARLTQPETIHQLLIAGQPSDYPPLLTDDEPPELPTGRTGVPGYELREQIGRGLFGTVFRGYQPSVGREVAIKVINPKLANDPAFIRRFAVEAKMISRIEHTNVVPLYDFWRGPDGALLVMRLMRGGNLADRSQLDRGGVLRLVDQIGGALAAAHSLAVAHGDVQANNVLLNESGDFFLGDFGIATDAPITGGRLAQELDTAAFAAVVGEAARSDALTEPEKRLLESARRGDFGNASEFISTWRAELGGVTTVPSFTRKRNPYKGLSAFSELDAQDFHGRDATIADLVATVASQRLVAAVGPSGVGKSSVVRAGLLPALRSGAVAGSEKWFIADCLPGSHPFERLASALVRVASSVPHDLEDMLRASERGLVKAVDRFLPDGAELLLVVDQFEELFTLARDEAERDQFLDLLAASVQDASGRVRVLVTMRADFFDRPLRHTAFGELLRAGTVPISAPTNEEMRGIITMPAAGVGIPFEPGLVERMIGEVQGEAGALPLVEFTLTELFEQRDADLMTLASYDASGGVTAALGRRAESIFMGLDEESRSIAHRMFLRLVTPGHDGSDTRRRLRRSELERTDVDESTLSAVLSAFGEHRLLTFDRDEVTRGATVEVAHEALIREWPRLKGWIDTNREELILRGRLAAAVADWEQAGRSEAFLLAGGGLTQHEAWTESTELALSDPERELLADSRAAEDERAARRKRMRQLVLSGFAAAAVIALVLSVFALNARRDADDRRIAAEQAEAQAEEQAILAQQERDRAEGNAERADQSASDAIASADLAERQRQVAEGRALLAAIPNIIEDDPQLALLLSTAATDRLGDIPSATAALHESIAAERTIYEVAGNWGDMSPDGRLLATMTGAGNTVEVHDIDAGTILWSHTFDVEPSGDFTFSADNYSFSAKFVNDGTELVTAVAWLPEAAQSFDPPSPELGFHVWDATTGDLKRRMDGGPCGPLGRYVNARGYFLESSDSHLVVASISESWHAENGCGNWQAVPTLDVHRVDAVTGERTAIIEGWESPAFELEISMSADGELALLGGYIPPAGTMQVINIDTGELVQNIQPPPTLSGGGISPDGSLVHSAGNPGEFLFHDVATGEALFETTDPPSDPDASGAWFSDDGQLFYVGYFDGGVRIFDTTNGRLVDSLPPIDGIAMFSQLSRDNRRMVVFGGGMAKVSTLEPTGAAEVARFNPCGPTADDTFYLNRGLAVHDDLISIYAFCDFSGGAYEVPASVYTYSRVTGELVATHQAFAQRFVVIDGDRAVMQRWSETADGTLVTGQVSIVDVRSGDVLETLPDVCDVDWATHYSTDLLDCVRGSGVGIQNNDLAVSADGRIGAIANWTGGDAYAWDLDAGTFVELGNPVHVLAMSPDGTRLIAGEPRFGAVRAPGAIRLYDTDGFVLLEEHPTPDDDGLARQGLKFSTDGATIAAMMEGGDVRFHDAATLKVTGVLSPHEIGIRDLTFSLDGTAMATVGADGFARVWDLETLGLLHEIQVGGFPTAVAFAETDTQLAVTTRHGGVRVFHLEIDSILDVARERLSRGFTEDECRVYFPDGECPTIEEVVAG